MDVVGDIVHVCDDDDQAPLLNLSAFALFLIMLSLTSGKLYRPRSLLRFGFRVLMYMAFFTTLSNHLDSVVSISVFSNSTECRV